MFKRKFIVFFSIGLSISLLTCIFFFLYTEELPSDPDNLNNYVKLPLSQNSIKIEILAGVVVSSIFTIAHIVSYIVLLGIYLKNSSMYFHISSPLSFNKPIANNIIPILLYLLGIFFLWDYYNSNDTFSPNGILFYIFNTFSILYYSIVIPAFINFTKRLNKPTKRGPI